MLQYQRLAVTLAESNRLSFIPPIVDTPGSA
jgi:hypothetical protein